MHCIWALAQRELLRERTAGEGTVGCSRVVAKVVEVEGVEASACRVFSNCGRIDIRPDFVILLLRRIFSSSLGCLLLRIAGA